MSALWPHKACPIVLRRRQGVVELLAFAHPLAGRQLVKGTIEPGESAADAAVRELREEAGVESRALTHLANWDSGYEGQVWSFHLCRLSADPGEAWTHRCADDGGHDFAFFWQRLDETPLAEWHPVHARALDFVRTILPADPAPS